MFPLELMASESVGTFRQHTAKPKESARDRRKDKILFVEVFMVTRILLKFNQLFEKDISLSQYIIYERRMVVKDFREKLLKSSYPCDTINNS